MIVVLFKDFSKTQELKIPDNPKVAFVVFLRESALFGCLSFVQIRSDLGQAPVGAGLLSFETSLRNCVFDVCNGAPAK